MLLHAKVNRKPSTVATYRGHLGATFFDAATSGNRSADTVLGFYTLSALSIDLTSLPDKLSRTRQEMPVPTTLARPFPAVYPIWTARFLDSAMMKHTVFPASVD